MKQVLTSGWSLLDRLGKVSQLSDSQETLVSTSRAPALLKVTMAVSILRTDLACKSFVILFCMGEGSASLKLQALNFLSFHLKSSVGAR